MAHHFFRSTVNGSVMAGIFGIPHAGTTDRQEIDGREVLPQETWRLVVAVSRTSESAEVDTESERFLSQVSFPELEEHLR